jgi:hypothetical protein
LPRVFNRKVKSLRDVKKKNFVRQARLPGAAYKKDLFDIWQPYIKKTMATNKVFQIIKRPDDIGTGQKILRIMIGGNAKKGYYITYRGNLTDIKDLLGSAYKSLTFTTKEPPVIPD